MLAEENLAEDVELGRVADRTDGYSGSDLREVCTAAAMRPLRDLLKATGKSAQIIVSPQHDPHIRSLFFAVFAISVGTSARFTPAGMCSTMF